MPHVIIECSATIAAEAKKVGVCEAAFQILNESGLFGANDIKTRLHVVDDFHVGPMGKGASFIHALIHLLEGRPLEKQKALTAALHTKLKQLVPQAFSVTVDIRDIARETYQK